MSDAQSRLSDAADKAEIGADILQRVAEGDENTEVETATGPRPTVAKWFKDRYAEFYDWSAGILGGNLDAAARAEAAAVRADFARDAAEDAVQYDYPSVSNQTALMAITGMTTGQRAFVRDTEHVWRYDGSSWVDLGLGPTAGKANSADFAEVAASDGLFEFTNNTKQQSTDDGRPVVTIAIDPASYATNQNLSGVNSSTGAMAITVSVGSGSGGVFSTDASGGMKASAGTVSPVFAHVDAGAGVGVSEVVIAGFVDDAAANSAGPIIAARVESGNVRCFGATISSSTRVAVLHKRIGTSFAGLTTTNLVVTEAVVNAGDVLGVGLHQDGDDWYAAVYVNGERSGLHKLTNDEVTGFMGNTRAGVWSSPTTNNTTLGAWGFGQKATVTVVRRMVTVDDDLNMPEAVVDRLAEDLTDRITSGLSAVARSGSAGDLTQARNSRIMTRAEQLKLASAGGGQPIPYELHPATIAYRDACSAGGITLTRGRLNRHSYLMDRLDAAGILERLTGLWLWSPEGEGAWLINHVSPGTHDLTRIGSPGYSTSVPFGAYAATPADALDTGIPVTDLDHDDASMGVLTTTIASAATGVVAGADIGASPAATTRCALWSYRADTKPYAHLGNTTISSPPSTAAGRWDQGAWHAISRLDAANLTFSNYGVGCAELAAASTPFLSDATIQLFRPLRSGVQGLNHIAGAFVGRGLTESQMRELCAATQDFIDSSQYGDPFIYDVGVGPTIIRRDVIIEGCSLSSIICAYEVARRGYSVAIVGDWQDENIGDLGGMPANGIGNIDIGYYPWISGGLFREIVRWMNLVFEGRADTGTEENMRHWPLAYSLCVRQMLDPARAGINVGTVEEPEILLPGRDVEIYMTGGITSVSKSGTEIKSISTRDGRTFFGRMFGAGGYDGDMLHYADLPRRTGMGPQGVGYEAFSGWQPSTKELMPFDGVPLEIDAYRVEGDPTSGLLPIVSSPKGLAPGDADPALQTMTYRLTASTNLYNRGPKIGAVAPKGYDESQYEVIARMYAAYKAETGNDVSYSQVLTQYYLPRSCIDINTRGGLSMNMPNAGELYAAAGVDPVARRGVWEAIRAWTVGYFYWATHSSDARITNSVRTNLANFYLHSRHHLNPGRYGMLFVPKNVYRREPVFMAQNEGFVLDANDLMMPDGTVPRSQKTISVICYAWDSHGKRVIETGGKIGRVGIINNDTMGGAPGGANTRAPWPLEASLPDKNRCSNLVLLTCPSLSQMAWAPARMEPFMGQAAECLAIAIDLALRGDLAIQDVDYPTLRAQALSQPYNVIPHLPVVN